MTGYKHEGAGSMSEACGFDEEETDRLIRYAKEIIDAGKPEEGKSMSLQVQAIENILSRMGRREAAFIMFELLMHRVEAAAISRCLSRIVGIISQKEEVEDPGPGSVAEAKGCGECPIREDCGIRGTGRQAMCERASGPEGGEG